MNAPLTLPEDDIDFARYMRESEPLHKVKPASHWEEDLNAAFAHEPHRDPHVRMPWPRLASKVSFRPEELSLWFGINGHGKSLLLGQVMASAIAQGERCCIASFEMRPRKTLERMVRQWSDEARPAPASVRDFVKWADRKLWLYDQTSTVQPERVYAVIRYCAERLGVQQFVVDNLTKMITSDDDYSGQKAVVDKLTSLARGLGIHIHLVHHARKGPDENRPPRKFDALGASAITNLSDNVFVIWRNKAKYEAASVDQQQPDAMLIVDKQRHGSSWEGVQNLTFHQRSQQYLERGTSAMDLSAFPHIFKE